MGEHTDYNDGYVLPSVIPQRTQVELRRRDDDRVRAFSTALDQGPLTTPHEYVLGKEQRGRGWLDYVQGVTQALRQRGQQLTGFELRVESTVPPGSGLSSSAALEISLLRALRAAFQLPLSDVELAQLGQRAENDLVGAPVGILDQMASSLGGPGEALLLDTRTLAVERLPLPPSCELVVIHSGITHDHAQGDYRTRRAECEQAAAQLGVAKLRDVGLADLERVQGLPPPLDRRARHVITENARVLQAAAALRSGDSARLGELFYASHQSMQRDFAVSLPEIDLLVELGSRESAIWGARLTGGGFGGSVVMLARPGAGRSAAERIAAAYAERTGRTPIILVPAAAT
jgi:galactokinase